MKVVKHFNSHVGVVSCLAIDSEERYLLSGGYDKSIRLWSLAVDDNSPGNVQEVAPIKIYKDHGYQVYDISIASDNSRFVSCGGDRYVLLWDVVTGAVVQRLRGHTQRINSVSFMKAHSDRLIVSASYDSTVRVYDHRTSSESGSLVFSAGPLQVLDGAKDSVSSVCCSLPNTIIATCIDGCLRTFDIRRGEVTCDDFHDPITWVTVCNRGENLLLSLLNSQIYLQSRESGEILER